MKRLTLVRHAKSSWKDLSLSDFDRPLNKRGKQNAPMMGRRLADRGVEPDVILTSPAKRARKTARKIAAEIDYPAEEIEEEEALYEASLPTLVHVVRALDDVLEDVMLVGHNPGFTELANFLTDHRIDNLPTCGVYAVDFDVASWGHIEAGSGTLAFFDYPKKPDGKG